ncbi:MAG: GDP-mannose 4,6-dehydratase [bacterium]|nr:GDP-mannose 4,6-dehydratase [bacterium]
MGKAALITGANGQDGSYLAEFLLGEGYRVYGLVRRSSTVTTERIAHLVGQQRFELIAGDVTDATGVHRIVQQLRPDEIYNLAAQSHVGVSFDLPSATIEVNAVGPLNLLEAIRAESPHTRFYQAGTSELFGNSPPPQNENTPMIPRSPYAVAKLAAHSLVRLYREAYGVFACAGILFNHESPRRGEEFVTRKITMYVARLAVAMENNAGNPPGDWPKLILGNLDAKRDWSFAGDAVRGMWLMLQQGQPDDFVLASGESHSVREFLELAFKPLDLDYRDFVRIDPAFFRPAEVNHLCGDATKARRVLGWSPQVSFEELVTRMVESDMAREQDCHGLRCAS